MRLLSPVLRRLAFLVLAGTIGSSCGAHAQQMARPGWRGNSIAPEVWWRHATLVRLPGDTTFVKATAALASVSAVSADSLVLPDLEPGEGSPQPFAARFGTEEELDALLREASARRMHVLLQVPLARLAAHPDEVRFWMTRGIAGFDAGTVTAADMARMQALRSALDRFPGQRILLARADGDVSVDRRGALPFIRVVSDGASGAAQGPQFVEAGAKDASTASADGLLRSFLPFLMSSGQPIFDSRTILTDEGRAALKQMMDVRNAHPEIRGAQPLMLQTDGLRAWLLKSTQAGRRSMVIVENPGTAAATTHLSAALRAAQARGSFLRATLRTDGGMGGVSLDGASLPGGSLVIAELQ